MIQELNKHHKKFLTAIFVVVAASFSVWGPASCKTQANTRDINGKSYGSDALSEANNVYGLSRMIGFYSEDNNPYAAYQKTGPVVDLAKLLGSAGASKRAQTSRSDTGVEQMVTLVTLRDLAKKMGISVPISEVEKTVQTLDRFHTDGKFDGKKYDEFFSKAPDRALMEKQLTTMVKDALALQKMTDLVGGNLEASDYSANSAYSRQNAIVTTQLVTLARKEHESIKAEEKDAKEFYENQKTKKEASEMDPAVVSPASRNVRYVNIQLADRTEDITKLDAPAQEAKKKAWDESDKILKQAASDIFNAVAGVDDLAAVDLDKAVETVKKALGDKAPSLEVKNFANLSAENLPDEIKSDRKAQMDIIGSKKTVGSPKLQKGGSLVYQVVKDNPVALLDFDQVKDKLITKLTKDKVDAALTEKGNTVRNALETALTAKKSWEDALKEAKVTAAELVINAAKPDPKAPPHQQAVAQETQSQKVGTLSKNAVPSGDDKLLVYLVKREIMDSPKAADDIRQMKNSMGTKGNGGPFGGGNPVFNDWFEAKRDLADPTFVPAG